MGLTVTVAQAEDHGLHLAFLTFVAILGIVLTLAAVVDAARNRRRSVR